MLRLLPWLVLGVMLAGCGGGGGNGGGGNIGVNARVPDVVGLSQASAATAISNAGLKLGTVTPRASSTAPAGDVISQNPAAGTLTAPLATVDLIVASGLPIFDLADAFPNLPDFDQPIFLAPVPTDSRLVVVEQSGHAKVFDPASASGTTDVLDVSSLVVAGGEQGLLGFAFDPAFASNHFVYVNYTRSGDGATVIARYTWDGARMADANSAKVILTVAQPAANHNGGIIAFGSDGLLYVGLGDGGGADDQFGNGQNLNSLLAKILRIDVHPLNAANGYDVPPDNPFVGNANAKPEVWAMGFRNPWRFSFDRQTNMLWVGDVGQNQYEEIDTVTKGRNFGWPAFEGNHAYLNVPLASGTTYVAPIFEYDHSVGDAIIGGYVYRGSRFGALVGRYIYADFGSGTIWAVDTDGTNNTSIAQGGNPTSFGEDSSGELFVVDQNGRIYEFQDNGP
jgi:glucose/arabinose dehydrogenase